MYGQIFIDKKHLNPAYRRGHRSFVQSKTRTLEQGTDAALLGGDKII